MPYQAIETYPRSGHHPGDSLRRGSCKVEKKEMMSWVPFHYACLEASFPGKGYRRHIGQHSEKSKV